MRRVGGRGLAGPPAPHPHPGAPQQVGPIVGQWNPSHLSLLNLDFGQSPKDRRAVEFSNFGHPPYLYLLEVSCNFLSYEEYAVM